MPQVSEVFEVKPILRLDHVSRFLLRFRWPRDSCWAILRCHIGYCIFKTSSGTSGVQRGRQQQQPGRALCLGCLWREWYNSWNTQWFRETVWADVKVVNGGLVLDGLRSEIPVSTFLFIIICHFTVGMNKYLLVLTSSLNLNAQCKNDAWLIGLEWLYIWWILS